LRRGMPALTTRGEGMIELHAEVTAKPRLTRLSVLEHGVAAWPLGTFLKFGGLDESLHQI